MHLRIKVEKIKLFMKEKGWSTVQLAKKLQMDYSYINRVLKGERHAGSKFLSALLGLCQEEELFFEDFVYIDVGRYRRKGRQASSQNIIDGARGGNNKLLFKAFTVQKCGPQLKGGFYLPAEGRARRFPLVVLCHGIPRGEKQEKDGRDEGYPGLAREFAKKNLACAYFNFRGTGESGGDFYLPGWQDDLRAVLDHLLERVGVEKVFLVGFSGGAATAACVAAADSRVDGAVLAACPAHFGALFTKEKLPEILERGRKIGLFRTPGYPEDPQGWLKSFQQVDVRRAVGKIAPRPLFIIHGEEDDLVPLEDARLIYNAAREPKEIYLVPGAGHQLRREPRAVEKIIGWLQKQCS